MTPLEARRARKTTQRELAQDLRRKDREALRRLKHAILEARRMRGALLRTAREHCKTARSTLRDRQRAEREAFRDAQRAARALGRGECGANKQKAREVGSAAIDSTAAALRSERALQRQIANAGRPVRLRSTARERRQEDDDAVRSNLPPELVRVFDRVAKKIKGSARRSRTEAFLEWAEENPGEVIAEQQSDADSYLRDLLRTEKEHTRNVRKAGRYKGSPEKLAARLAEVPF